MNPTMMIIVAALIAALIAVLVEWLLANYTKLPATAIRFVGYLVLLVVFALMPGLL